MRIEQVSKPSDYCPFRMSEEGYGTWCFFENGNDGDYCFDDDNFPPGCPLIKEDILICAKTSDETKTQK